MRGRGGSLREWREGSTTVCEGKRGEFERVEGGQYDSVCVCWRGEQFEKVEGGQYDRVGGGKGRGGGERVEKVERVRRRYSVRVKGEGRDV